MNKQAVAETFDFTASFQQTLERFETLTNSSRTDYERAQRKRAQRIADDEAKPERPTK
ncbi:hypothetical protein [Ruegeria atlantica]|uniref:Uncharacterized protein n=1 Tax=Ruegeria atlantica TaxID=81569 RepID=A0ABX1WEC4_9RHOB|nr:hypothetical protein [Ruegeria atlantica]NOD31662.1 hypothetical protein [Ruegeria atlantica]